MALSPAVTAVVALGRMPSDDDADEDGLRQWVDALDGLDDPLTDEEAIAVLDCFPPDESTTFGVAWTLLHAVESAPYGPGLLAELDDRSWWVANIRKRAVRGGLISDSGP